RRGLTAGAPTPATGHCRLSGCIDATRRLPSLHGAAVRPARYQDNCMIKVTALYRWREGATFNHDYYHGAHMRIARQVLGPLGLLRLESDRVLYPGDPRPGQVMALTNAFFG